ncbi:MAG: hypothetical protein GY906_04730 [bacterium]|nr:hypothetical protein [bacterium]
MTKTREAIQNFLNNREGDSRFLLSRYSTDLETQVMTSTDGERDEDTGKFVDPNTQETWGNLRWPYQAGTDPNYRDPTISFSPAARVERLGTTWWDYVGKKSIAVGIDIDSEVGHADSTTTNNSQDIAEIISKLKDLDYVTIVKSTGGEGIHVYVFFDPASLPESNNHHEHTIVARKTLELISQDIDYNLKSHVDCVGSVFWIWAKSSPADHPGFDVVKEGTYLDASRLAAINLPSPSVRGKGQVDFETVDFDDDHKRIIEAISSQPFYFNVRSDMNLVHTHTRAIADAISQGLEVKGSFVTNSNGDDPMTANCFLAPLNNGAFRVVRFGNGQQEPNWEYRNSRNYCTLNESVSYQEVVSNASSGRRAGKYEITPDQAKEIASALGKPLAVDVPDDVWAVLIDGGTEFHSKKGADGWTKAGKTFKITIEADDPGNFASNVLSKADDHIRFVIQDGSPRGWYHKLESGKWLMHKSYGELACVVNGLFGEFADQAHQLMMQNPWNMVQIPFEEEYPGERRWNFNAPQLKVEPSESGGDHPHFDMILDHIGKDLNEAVLADDWCRKAGIQSGADFLRTWLACLIHYPDQPLPYLFLVGPQNSGKSVFHECSRFLFTHGVTSANSALTSGFNAELAGSFLVYVEERDLADKKFNAYEKIKEWVTGRDLIIVEKYQTPYQTQNYLHFVQMANSSGHLPLEDGDTRIIALEVPALSNPVPKAILEDHLLQEAPRFLRTLLNTTVPPPNSRLRIPAIATATKNRMERQAMSQVMGFTTERVFKCDGSKIEVEAFYSEFQCYCKERGTTAEPSFTVMNEVSTRSDRFLLGQRNGKMYILNMTFDAKAKERAELTVNSAGRF